MARNRRAAGVATDLEVLRFEVDLANARTTLLRLQGAADLARGDLNAVMVQPDRHADRADATRSSSWTRPAEQQQVVREATASRPEVQAIAWNEKIYDEAIGIYKADMQPRLDLDARLRLVRARDRATSSSRTTRSGALAVTLKVPVFDGWRTAGKVAQARADRAKVGQDRVALETRIDLEAKQAVDRLRVAASVFRAAELNVAQARKAPRDDRGQLPPRRRHDPRRARRPGRAHPGRVEPRRGAPRPRQRPRRAALRAAASDPLADSPARAPADGPR